MTTTIGIEDPRKDDVRALLLRHLDFAATHSPPEDVHALDVDALVRPDLTFVSCRDGDLLLGVGALRMLTDGHAELKSMHTAAEARGRGVGSAIVAHLIALARDNGCTRVSLETGTMEAFTPARALYARHGFEPSGPFGDYVAGPNNTFMTLPLRPESPTA